MKILQFRKNQLLLTLLAVIALMSCDGGGGGGTNPLGKNEGSVDSPVTVTAENPYSGSIGPDGDSYYQFMAPTTGIYTISLTNTKSDLSWTLFSNSFFSNVMADCDMNIDAGPANEICDTPTLTGGNTYYIGIIEWDDRGGTFTLTVNVKP